MMDINERRELDVEIYFKLSISEKCFHDINKRPQLLGASTSN